VTPRDLLDLFDHTYVINLPERADRRRDMHKQLQVTGVGAASDILSTRVEFVPGVRPAEAAPFGSVGVKGCFLSHLAVLNAALLGGFESVMILEDDAEFEGNVAEIVPRLEEAILRQDWGIVQLGYLPMTEELPTVDGALVPFRGDVQGLHCYAVHRKALVPLIGHFERQLAGRAGDDIYGPMAADGTVNTFAWVNHDVPRHLLVPSICRQRSSRSDISPAPLDRIPFTRALVAMARRARRMVRQGR